MAELTIPAPPPKKPGTFKTRPKQPFPEAQGENKIYVVSVQKNAPFEYVDISGVHFTKYTVARECSSSDYSGPPKINTPTAMLAENQVEFLKERAKLYDIKINSNRTVQASDYIILCSVEDFYKKQLESSLVKTQDLLNKYKKIEESQLDEEENEKDDSDPLIKSQLKKASKK